MHKEKTPKQLKLNGELQRVFSEIFSEQDLFPGKKNIYVNVLEADISPDLKNIKILVDIFGIDAKTKLSIVGQLNSVIPHFKNEMNKKIKFKYMPNIKFILDDSVEKGININKVIEKGREDFE